MQIFFVDVEPKGGVVKLADTGNNVIRAVISERTRFKLHNITLENFFAVAVLKTGAEFGVDCRNFDDFAAYRVDNVFSD